MNDLLFFRPNEDFHLFGSQRLLTMAMIIAVSIGMAVFGKKHLPVFLVNLLLGSNYAYLMGKPPTASAFGYLGDYPWHLLVSEALALVLFVLVLLPALPRKRKTEA